ncbi:MAG: hypothetical protein K2X35_08660 [Bryobacteraceae bacterium]|nr:hypothetical protein [Bryobacteraceae bacterium]
MLAVIVALGADAADPPADLARRVAARESRSQEARSRYLYRQSVKAEELDRPGAYYSETREVIFSPTGERSERFLKHPEDRLQRLKLTEEDFADIRNIQPLMLTSDVLHLYETRYRGAEPVGDQDCWVLQVRPRQILEGQRLFDGLIWIHPEDFSIVRAEGRAVPQIYSRKQENLFPRFVTIRERMKDGNWFPVKTVAEDTLPFRTGALRMRLTITYTGYRKFGAESNVTFEPVR